MRLFDQHFKGNSLRYLLQCCLATVSVLVILALLKSISNVAVIAALGASAFIAFALPHVQSSKPRFLIGGYLVAVVVGSVCYLLSRQVPLPEKFGAIPDFPQVVFGAVAVGLVSFAMVLTNTEHPPAAGLALGFVFLSEWYWLTPVAVMAGIVALVMVRRLLKPFLRNLI